MQKSKFFARRTGLENAPSQPAASSACCSERLLRLPRTTPPCWAAGEPAANGFWRHQLPRCAL